MTSKVFTLIALLLSADIALAQGSNSRMLHGDVTFNDNTVQTTAATSGITALTGDVTASGTGSVAATVAFVGGSAAAAVNTATAAANAATSANTASTIVKRDGSGHFVAGLIESASGGFKFPDASVQTTAATATPPGGATGAVQFNASGVFTGDAGNFFWDNSAKRLGIGTTTPATTLDVAGTVRSTAETPPTAGAGLEMRYTGGIGYIGAFDRDLSVGMPLHIDSKDLSLNTFDASYKTGIGTASPNAPLHVFTSVGGSPGMIVENTSSFPVGIDFKDGAGTPNQWFIGSGVSSATDGKFRILDYRQLLDRLVIDTSGQVGIGTTAPGALLEVNSGGNYVRIDPASAGGPRIVPHNASLVNTLIGDSVASTLTTGNFNTLVGANTDVASSGTSGVTALGYLANGAGNSVSIGNAASTSSQGVAVGYIAKASDVSVGFSAGSSLSGGTADVFVGNSSGAAMTTGSSNAAVGTSAMSAATGSQNSCIGGNCLNNVSGNRNVAAGTFAAQSVTSGTDNTIVGSQAGAGGIGAAISTGSGNSILGFGANVDSAAASFRTVIGDGALGTVDNSVTLGRSTDGVIVPDTGGHGGNVPHGYSKVVGTTATTSATCAAQCPANAIAVGGDCASTTVPTGLDGTHTSTTSTTDDTFNCDYLSAAGDCTATAKCFAY